MRKSKVHFKVSKNSVILLGGGGHARVLQDILEQREDVKILGYTDWKPREDLGLKYLGNDDALRDYSALDVYLVNAVGSMRLPQDREKVFRKGKGLGFRFLSVIHTKAVISTHTSLGEGVQVMAGAVVNTGAVIDDDVIINTNATVDHDGRIGAHTHLAPGVTLSGHVVIGAGCHLGTGACVIQGIAIGRESLIGAGAVVIRDLPERVMAWGIPAVKQAVRSPVFQSGGLKLDT